MVTNTFFVQLTPIIISLGMLSKKRKSARFQFSSWNILDTSQMVVQSHIKERISSRALLPGYFPVWK